MAEELLQHLKIPSTTDSRYSSSSPISNIFTNFPFSTFPNPAHCHLQQYASSSYNVSTPYLQAWVGSRATQRRREKRRRARLRNSKMANDLREHIYVPPHEGPYYSANTSPALQPSEPFGQPSGNNTTIPGPNLTDIESYLQESAHLIIDGKARKGKQGSNASKAAATDAIQLTPGGGASQSAEGTTRSATSTSILANTCQSKGINLVWDVKAHPQKVQGAEKFIGTLNVGTQTVSVTEPQSSKKDVRALLAERALPIAEEMERPAKKQKSESRESGEGEQVNWVGKLQGALWFSAP